MNGLEMEFGGYGVPAADKEAMLRHFAPVMLQDGQIGCDRDTMMMWSTFPSSFECVYHFVSLFCLVAEANMVYNTEGRKIGKHICQACWVLLLRMWPILARRWMVAG
jgi:hypothetical protein